MDGATKQEIKNALASLPSPPKHPFSSLVLKIAAGYLVMAVFTIAALAFSSFNLYMINNTAREIARVDLTVVSALIKMRTSLLAQESYAGKYTIFKDATFIGLFRQREKESLENLVTLERTGAVQEIAVLKRLYLDYQAESEKLFGGRSGSRAKLQASALRLLTTLDALYIKRQDMLQQVLKSADDHRKAATRWGIWLYCTGFLLAILIVTFFIYRIFRALKELQKATHRIAQGDFNYEPQTSRAEELNDLTNDINDMAARIQEMERTNVESLPLTRLPGNLAIERVLDERLQSGLPFAVCHVNLENFRPFNAHYGYAKGSDLLRATGYLIHAAVRHHGADRDFAGHVGGDDFVMVVSPDRVAPVCDAVIRGFDEEVIKHYSPEDQQARGFQRRDRYGVDRSFPITTIFISVINCSVAEYSSVVEITRAAADVRASLRKASVSSWEIVS